MNANPATRKALEGCPCALCDRWHLGRLMSLDELHKGW